MKHADALFKDRSTKDYIASSTSTKQKNLAILEFMNPFQNIEPRITCIIEDILFFFTTCAQKHLQT